MALQYETTKEHTITVTGYEGTVRHLVIPDQVDGCPVKTIGKNAFSAREDLESVSIPKTVETLGRYAFYNCKKLKSISLYDRRFCKHSSRFHPLFVWHQWRLPHTGCQTCPLHFQSAPVY